MTRPAQPGDLCVIIREDQQQVMNVGKQCTCVEQCECVADSWRCTSHEPVVRVLFANIVVRCEAGESFCCNKRSIIPLTNPDAEDASTTSKENEHVHQ